MIEPFKLSIAEHHLNDLHERLYHTRWPQELQGLGWSRGVPLAYLKELTDYWRTTYDWRKNEAKLNEFAQFTTTIDGQNIHFLHVQSPESNALPLIVTHGYPSSIIEFMQILGPLTNPRAYGADPADAFHIVAPSLPGFGFSIPLSDKGWFLPRIAGAWDTLMQRLGYNQYGAQGGDIGGGVAGLLGNQPHVLGVHINADPVGVALTGVSLPESLPDLSAVDKLAVDQMRYQAAEGKGYLQIQGTRPQTLAYGLNDSPVEQLAWIIEKFKEWSNPAFEKPEHAMDLDQLLTNISVYWFSGTGASAAHFIYEAMHSRDWIASSLEKQGWVVFGGAGSFVRSLMDPEHKIEHWSQFEQGGHFAAMETPDLLVEDIRRYFRKLRQR